MTSETEWYKSSFSGKQGNCVEVLRNPDGSRYVRDSKDKNGAVLHFTTAEWLAFIKGVRNGEFG